MTPQETLALADRFFAAIEKGDTTTVGELYAPDVKVWHNYDQIEQERDANLATLGWMARKVSGIRYEEIRREVLPDGFLQQHTRFRRIELERCDEAVFVIVDLVIAIREAARQP